MEKFSYLNSAKMDGKEVFLEVGNGFVTMDDFEGAYAKVEDLVTKRKHGILISATAVLIIRYENKEKILLLKRSEDAKFEPNMWQSPAGRVGIDEIPLDCAMRELIEEVHIDGYKKNFKDVLIHQIGKEIEYALPEITHTFRAKYIYVKETNTLEFYFPFYLNVQTKKIFKQLKFKDNEAYNREIGLFTKDEVLNLHKDNILTQSMNKIVELEFFSFDNNFFS